MKSSEKVKYHVIGVGSMRRLIQKRMQKVDKSLYCYLFSASSFCASTASLYFIHDALQYDQLILFESEKKTD